MNDEPKTPVAKRPSEDATTRAGRMINVDPFTDEAMERLWANIAARGPMRGDLPEARTQMAEALRETFADYLDDVQSIAGALLRLDPKAGQARGK